MPKHIFFDLDNTVTRSRSKIAEGLKGLLAEAPFDVIIVSGATHEQITFQVDGVSCYKLGQNGNHATDPTGGALWEERLSDSQKEKISQHVALIERTWAVPDESDLVQDRGCQVSYSLLGHNAVLEDKEAFDPDGAFRSLLLEKFPFSQDGMDVKIGGTTCLDYTVKNMHKGHYVARLIEQMNWDKEECVYFGDMLFPGGNDESVIGVIKTQPVDNPEHTASLITELLAAQ